MSVICVVGGLDPFQAQPLSHSPHRSLQAPLHCCAPISLVLALSVKNKTRQVASTGPNAARIACYGDLCYSEYSDTRLDRTETLTAAEVKLLEARAVFRTAERFLCRAAMYCKYVSAHQPPVACTMPKTSARRDTECWHYQCQQRQTNDSLTLCVTAEL